MVGVVPLGTGNDMARVLGWGAQCHDEEKLPTILSEMEQSSFKLVDRWSIQYSPEPDLDVSSLITAVTVSDVYCISHIVHWHLIHLHTLQHDSHMNIYLVV